MTSVEREICARLKFFRETILWSQHDFARKLGITYNQLASIEYARTPLKFRIAWKVREVFRLSLSWLMGGKCPPNLPDLDPWPNPESLKDTCLLLSEIGRSLSFSDLSSPAHKEAEKIWFQTIRKKTVREPQRAAYFAVLKGEVDEWIARVPDASLQDFANQLIGFADDYLSQFPGGSGIKVSVRIKALIWGEMRDEINKRLLAKPTSGPDGKTDSKDNLDKKNPSTIFRDMRTEVPTWPELKKSIKRLTAGRGEKKALADECGVSRQVLGNWLSDDSQGTPNAGLTLKLLKWVSGKK